MPQHRHGSGRPAPSPPVDPRQAAAEARRQLAQRGWAALRSDVLGETVLIVRDMDVPLPEALRRRYVRYTFREVQLLRGTSPEALREIHAAKRVFGGEVIPAEGLPATVVTTDALPS